MVRVSHSEGCGFRLFFALLLSQFGGGELDKFDFSDTSPYEPKLMYDEARGFGSRPSSSSKKSWRIHAEGFLVNPELADLV
jgi:hypothetical protein